jgi:hypothetical protein
VIRGPQLEREQDRESIWSVSRQARDTYFVIFVALFFAGMALASLRSYNGGGSLLDSTLAVWSEAAPLAITAAAAALVLTEVGRSTVVLARRLEEGLERVRERRRAEGRAEGLAEGLAKGEARVQEAWQAWNQRRIEAAERGEPFTEPPPEPARE